MFSLLGVLLLTQRQTEEMNTASNWSLSAATAVYLSIVSLPTPVEQTGQALVTCSTAYLYFYIFPCA